jgi:hypothetical protein
MARRRQTMWDRLSKFSAAAVLATSLVVLVDPSTASACSCGELTDTTAVDSADAVFTGMLVDTVEPRWSPIASSGDSMRLVFDVDQVFKGEVFERQSVVTPRDEASCGWTPSSDGPFLVFATDASIMSDAIDGELHAGLCSGTRAVPDGQPPEWLGPGSIPISGASPVGGQVLPAVVTGTAVAAGVALAVAATAALRRRLRRRRTRRSGSR